MIRGSQIQSREQYTYGRFECSIRPAFGSGIISSFFLFNDEKGFQDNWQELDFEFLGRNCNQVDTNIIQTVNHAADFNKAVKYHVFPKRSSDVYWKLKIEWTPFNIRWFVNDFQIRIAPVNLTKPMKIMLNIWKSDDKQWAGDFHEGLLPQIARYKMVKYSSYKDGKFTPVWDDRFLFFDEQRWYRAEHSLDSTKLTPSNVIVNNGLTLKLTV